MRLVTDTARVDRGGSTAWLPLPHRLRRVEASPCPSGSRVRPLTRRSGAPFAAPPTDRCGPAVHGREEIRPTVMRIRPVWPRWSPGGGWEGAETAVGFLGDSAEVQSLAKVMDALHDLLRAPFEAVGRLATNSGSLARYHLAESHAVVRFYVSQDSSYCCPLLW